MLKVENNERKEIIGFFSLSADAVFTSSEYSDSKIVLSGSAIRIYMFAIDEKYQKKKVKINVDGRVQEKTYASLLLLTCFDYIDDIVNNYIGAMYIVLNATKEGKGLYKNIGGFLELETDEKISYIEGDGPCVPMYKFIKEE